MKQKSIPNQRKQSFRSRAFSCFAFVAYILILLDLTLFSPYFGRVNFHRSLNLIPFSTILRYWPRRYLAFAFVNLAGNIAAFIPFGFLLPLVAKKGMGFWKLLGWTLIASLFIEVIQYALGVGVSDVDDIILNLAGGIIGWILFKVFIDLRHVGRR